MTALRKSPAGQGKKACLKTNKTKKKPTGP